MSRPLRVQFAGGWYHVTARGNARQGIFADSIDYERFLSILDSITSRYRLLCHAYCLMTNHYHLLLQTPEPNLSVAMQQLNGVYARHYNFRHQRSGHLLGARFHAQIVEKDAHLLEATRYIVLNPYRAGLVAHPCQWPWSSYRATAGDAPAPEFLTVDWLLALIDKLDRTEAQRRYKDFVGAGLDKAMRGVDVACDQTRDGAGVASTQDTPSTRSPRLAGESADSQPRSRPTLEELFMGIASRRDRDLCVRRAVEAHGYSQRSIARFLGLNSATVTRALARVGTARENASG